MNRDEEKTIKQDKNRLWLILAIVFAIAAVISGCICIGEKVVQARAEAERQALMVQVNINMTENSADVPAESVPAEPEPEPTPEPPASWEEMTLEEKYQYYLDTYGIEVPKKELDFQKLQEEVNEDIYAWVYVPGTNVDDPVVQHPTDDTYYLNYNLNGTKGYPGGIYTESCNARDFKDRMTVIYGHNMKNGKGFGTMHNFEDAGVFEENRYIFIYMPDDILVYEIFAAYVGSNNHIIYGHDWDDTSWVQYLNDTLLPIWEKHNALETCDFTPQSKVLTLATCVRNSPNERYLVQGVLLNEDW